MIGCLGGAALGRGCPGLVLRGGRVGLRQQPREVRTPAAMGLGGKYAPGLSALGLCRFRMGQRWLVAARRAEGRGTPARRVAPGSARRLAEVEWG